MPGTALVSKWRMDLAGVRQRLRHYPASLDSLYDNDRMLGLIYSAEEFVQQPLRDTSGWTADAQDAFNTAVLEMVQLWTVNPDFAKSTKDDVQARTYWDQVPFAVKTFWENFADGVVPGSGRGKAFVLGRFTK